MKEKQRLQIEKTNITKKNKTYAYTTWEVHANMARNAGTCTQEYVTSGERWEDVKEEKHAQKNTRKNVDYLTQMQDVKDMNVETSIHQEEIQMETGRNIIHEDTTEGVRNTEYREEAWEIFFGFISGMGHTEDNTKHQQRHTERDIQTD